MLHFHMPLWAAIYDFAEKNNDVIKDLEGVHAGSMKIIFLRTLIILIIKIF